MPSIFRITGIRARLILLLLIVLVPVLLIGSFFYYKMFESRRDGEYRANLEVARSVAKNFNTFIQDIVHTELIIGRAFTAFRSISVRDRNRILDDFKTDNPVIRTAVWIDPEGSVVASSVRPYVGLDVCERSYVKDIVAGRDWAVSELLMGKVTGQPVFTISRSIRDERGKLLGIVAASVEPDRLDDVLGIDRSLEAAVSLIDHKGVNVYRYPRTAHTAERHNWFMLHPVMNDALKGKEVTMRHKSRITGRMQLAAYVPVHPIGWAAAASTDEDEAMWPIIRAATIQASLILFVALLGFIAATFSSRRISDSIIKLRDHALSFGRKDFQDFMITSGPDEVKDLSSALNEMAREMRHREEQLESANKELESFSYSVSHDLRAPLRAIDGFSRMLLKKTAGKLSDDERRRFDVIRDNTKKMGQLIDDILAFSRLGRQGMTKVDLDMGKLIRDVWEELVAIDPDRKMSLNIGPMLASVGDQTLIRQVCANILSNAVKFTRSRDEAIIEAGSRREGNEIVYYVRDNGVGFDMAYYGKLFGAFQRLHGPDEYEGTGVGMAIAKRIIDRHGGRIWAEGKADQGATFYFTLPNRPQ